MNRPVFPKILDGGPACGSSIPMDNLRGRLVQLKQRDGTSRIARVLTVDINVFPCPEPSISIRYTDGQWDRIGITHLNNGMLYRVYG